MYMGLFVFFFGKSAKLKQLNIPLHIVIIVYHNPKDFAVVSKYQHVCEGYSLLFLSAYKKLRYKLCFKFKCFDSF